MTNGTKIHIISDLFLGFNELCPDEEKIPDVDLVIINGNIGHIKRAMLYIETLCKKYPDIPFILNLGEYEQRTGTGKSFKELSTQLEIRKNSSNNWPQNLHWSQKPIIVTCKNGAIFNVLSVYGYPKIHSYEDEWKDTRWAKYYVTEIIDDYDPTDKWYKPAETSFVRHGPVAVYATLEWINNQHELEKQKVKEWELSEGIGIKLLITHINPYKDNRFEKQVVSPYLIHLENGLWITSNTKCNGLNFLGANLCSNPGRGIAREVVFTV